MTVYSSFTPGKQLQGDNGQTLAEDYNVRNLTTLHLLLRLPGGYKPGMPLAYHGKLKPLPGYIRLTTEPCMISFDDNMADRRAKMPCGHAISNMNCYLLLLFLMRNKLTGTHNEKRTSCSEIVERYHTRTERTLFQSARAKPCQTSQEVSKLK